MRGWRTTTVSAPGQNASIRSRAGLVNRDARPSTVRTEPIRTGTGMSRPRPFAASSASTALWSNASAPTPYTVSVGSTTSSPRCTEVTARCRPVVRCCGSAQS